MNDGLLNQDRNPEVRVDINRPDVDINEQILSLKLITKKLESAHNGHDVEWPTTSNRKFFFLTFFFVKLFRENTYAKHVFMHFEDGSLVYWDRNRRALCSPIIPNAFL